MSFVRIGDVELFFIEAGSLKLDGGAMFGTVPRELWKNWTPPDAQNRILLSTRCVLVKTPTRNILIDGGVGSHWDTKFSDMFAVNSQGLEGALKDQAGILAKDVSNVIVTHWHFDHVGGLVKSNSHDHELVRIFENAEIHTQLSNFNTARDPSDRERASYLSKTWAPYEKSGQIVLGQLRQSMDIEEVCSGVFVQRSDGHTIGQQIVHLPIGSEHLVFCADLIPTSHHVKPHYSMGYDVQPLVLEREKRLLLTQAAAQNWTLIFEHDPYVSAAKVIQKESSKGLSFELVPVSTK